ncbi:YfiR family protein [Azonexus sp. IMCC34839]|uniref:YfiR family protein n=1 Tax=Azonexus sp. IMCC34839 TaxID=3133695 RepID=UPI00399A6FC1
MSAHQLLTSVRRLALCLAMALATPTSFSEVASEGQLKAAYLINFLKYIEWPVAKPTVTICLFGRDSLGPYLAPYEGRSVAGKELRIRRVSSPEQLADCQELFVPDTEEARYAAILRWTDKQPILTVSDNEIFARDGGSVSLIRQEGRLQFDINTDAMGRAGLKPSSQMMRLARQVIGSTR